LMRFAFRVTAALRAPAERLSVLRALRLPMKASRRSQNVRI